jgi:hypothetical protein
MKTYMMAHHAKWWLVCYHGDGELNELLGEIDGEDNA